MLKLLSNHDFFSSNSNHRMTVSAHADTDTNASLSYRYQDYDSRPIKPLDDESLKQQLAKYNELSKEELEIIQKKK